MILLPKRRSTARAAKALGGDRYSTRSRTWLGWRVPSACFVGSRAGYERDANAIVGYYCRVTLTNAVHRRVSAFLLACDEEISF